MAKAFDVTTKHLLEGHPADWLAYAGLPPGTAPRVVDADLSSFSVSADKVIRVDAPAAYVAHFEFQSGVDVDLDRRILLYNVLLRWRHGLPVRSVVLLLRPEARSGRVRGRVEELAGPGDRLDFAYTLLPVWEQPVGPVLAGGLGTLPLAPICAVGPADLPGVLRRVEERFAAEAAPPEARELRAATYLLMGLRYPREVVDQLLTGVRDMEESSTYQAILEKGIAKGIVTGIDRGKAEGERTVLVRLGTKKFGAPDAETRTALQAITDPRRLEELAERILVASSWEELLRTGD